MEWDSQGANDSSDIYMPDVEKRLTMPLFHNFSQDGIPQLRTLQNCSRPCVWIVPRRAPRRWFCFANWTYKGFVPHIGIKDFVYIARYYRYEQSVVDLVWIYSRLMLFQFLSHRGPAIKGGHGLAVADPLDFGWGNLKPAARVVTNLPVKLGLRVSGIWFCFWGWSIAISQQVRSDSHWAFKCFSVLPWQLSRNMKTLKTHLLASLSIWRKPTSSPKCPTSTFISSLMF